MRLRCAQHEQFRREGYLFLPALFTPAEVRVLRHAAAQGVARSGAGRPPGPGATGPAAAAVLDSPLARLARHPRLLRPAQALAGRRLALHRLQVEDGEAGQHGNGWPCQAAGCGALGLAVNLALGLAVNLAIFLDDIHEGQARWMFIPGSHRHSGLEAYDDLGAAGGYPSWTLDYPLIGRRVARAGGRREGVAAPCGPAGSTLLFDARLMPAPCGGPLPAGIHLSLVPANAAAHVIDCLADDCLLKDGHVQRPDPGVPAPPWRRCAPPPAARPAHRSARMRPLALK